MVPTGPTPSRRGDLAAFGRLMSASHASSRDDFANSSPALDALIESAEGVARLPRRQALGRGWAGCTVNLVAADQADAFAASVAAALRPPDRHGPRRPRLPRRRRGLGGRVFPRRRSRVRTRVFRSAALILGLLGIPSLGLQVWKAWPAGQDQWSFFGVQAAVLFAFVMYGLGLAYQTPVKTGGTPVAAEPFDPTLL